MGHPILCSRGAKIKTATLQAGTHRLPRSRDELHFVFANTNALQRA